MIRTVEVINPAGGDQAVLDSTQRIGRAAAHHEGSAVEVFLMDQVFRSQRIIILRNQVNMTCMRYLGRNMAWLLKLKEAGEAAGVLLPVQEETRISTNFIR